MPNAIPAIAPPMTSHTAFTRRVASKAPALTATRHEETLTMLARPSCHVTTAISAERRDVHAVQHGARNAASGGGAARADR